MNFDQVMRLIAELEKGVNDDIPVYIKLEEDSSHYRYILLDDVKLDKDGGLLFVGEYNV